MNEFWEFNRRVDFSCKNDKLNDNCDFRGKIC